MHVPIHNIEFKVPDFRLERSTFLDKEFYGDGELHIVINETIRASHHSTVYRGSAGTVNLVVKMWHEPKFSGEDFCSEAKAYEIELSSLQGTVIPKFYGYYKGMDHEKSNVSCIVLEDCGDYVGQQFDALETTDKYVSCDFPVPRLW